MRPAAVLICAALLVGCAVVPPDDARPDVSHGMATVHVTASYRERIALPPGHVLTVRIEDVSLADAPARVLAEHTEILTGRAPPFVATLGFPRSQVDPRHTYAARADVRDADGRLRFVTDTRHAVLTHGAPTAVEIVMVAAGR